MSKAAMQQALDDICGAKLCEFNSMSSRHEMVRLMDSAITALRAALAEPDSDYERGFVDGMNLQTKGSVDKAVNRMAEQNPFGDDAERYARKLHEEREYYKALFTVPTPQPEQEPVAHLWQHSETGRTRIIGNDEMWTASNQWFCVGPLYLGSAPTPRKPWVGLTVEEIFDCAHHITRIQQDEWVATDADLCEFAHFVEQELKKKNGYGTWNRPLSKLQIDNICKSFRLGYTDEDLVRAIERAHGIGEQHE